ncbi:hypothetical protein WN943_006574 [Citrus x changshan-huyou]
MGKQGPCLHCGIERTPLWRNGPPEKPVLCNACGSRYRLRGTLNNYAPKHLQSAFPLKKKKQESKMILINSSRTEEKIYDVSSSSCDDVYRTAASEGCENNINDGSSSSESTTISCTEAGSCIESEIQQSLWDVHIPSRKRSLVVYQSLSPIERLQRDLNKILRHRQDPNSSIISESQDGVLLYNLNSQIIYPSEIGLGTILLK